MMKLVVDASVVAKWLFAEVDSDRARDIYRQAERTQTKSHRPADIACRDW